MFGIFSLHKLARAARVSDKTYQNSLQVDLGLGGLQSRLTSESSRANYTGFGLVSRISLPILFGERFGVLLSGSYRLQNQDNTSNFSERAEVMKMEGPGAGLRIQWRKFFIGSDYVFLKSRNLSIGTENQFIDSRFDSLNYYLGFMVLIQSFGVGMTYSHLSGIRSFDQVNFDGQVRYTENSVLLNFTWVSNLNLFEIFY